MTTCLQKLLELHAICCFQTIEGDRVGPASKSEIRRWFQQSVVEVNYRPAAHDDPWPAYIASLVLFPKNPKKRTTLYHDPDVHVITVDEKVLNRIRQEAECPTTSTPTNSLPPTPSSSE